MGNLGSGRWVSVAASVVCGLPDKATQSASAQCGTLREPRAQSKSSAISRSRARGPCSQRLTASELFRESKKTVVPSDDFML